MTSAHARTGRLVRQPTGYSAFIPAPLPPDPPVAIDDVMLPLLSRADQAIGRLDGLTQILPGPDVFVAMYVRREAVLSSQIEGTQSTLEDVLRFELDPQGYEIPKDVEEVVNYVRAMNYGLDRLATLPLSLRLIREIHAELMQGVRGSEKQPGEFRRSQNWIGPAGVPLSRATYVPPPPADMLAALDNLERFLHDETLPALVHAGLAHAQFEAIHPFLDGNGRVGRLLITLLLCHRGVLHRPLLYLSAYLKLYQGEYYDRLMAIRLSDDWEGWMRFFLRGVAETAEEATATARAILELREHHHALLRDHRLRENGVRLLDLLFQRPLVNAALVKSQLGVSDFTAYALVDRMEGIGVLREVTGGQRNRIYEYAPYLALFEGRQPPPSEAAPLQTTESEGEG